MKILCFGDSNTYGYDPRSYFGGQYPAQHRWVDLLARELGCTAINAGETGREIPRRESEFDRFHNLLTSQKPIERLLIMLGTNDLLQGISPEAVTARMERFIDQIDLEPSKILLIAPPPMKLGAWIPMQALVDASKELATAYEALSQRLGLGYANAGEWHIPLAFDGVHLTPEGHVAFAEGLSHYLKKEE